MRKIFGPAEESDRWRFRSNQELYHCPGEDNEGEVKRRKDGYLTPLLEVRRRECQNGCSLANRETNKRMKTSVAIAG